MRTVRSIVALWILGLAASCVAADSSDATGHRWLTGTALDEQLHATVGISWSNVTLRQALTSLSSSQRIAIVLDRRVDPDQEIRIELPGEPLDDMLRKIALSLHLGYTQLESVAYFGPAPTAKRLRTLASLGLDEVRRLSPAAARKFLQLKSSQWKDLAEPRKLIEGLASEVGATLSGADKVPYDLWLAADLPPLSWIDRVTLLAAQFGLTFHLADRGHRVDLVAIPAQVAIGRNYRVPRQAAEVAKSWSAILGSSAHVTATTDQVRVEGLIEDQELIERRLRGTPTRRATTSLGKEVYQLTIENKALQAVAEQLAQRIGLELRWDRAAIERAGVSLDQLISFQVQNVDVDELLRALFKGTGLTFERADKVVTIRPAAAR
ncbi:MAG TPA: STN domain-containing protein [Pirellulales bacterium]|nr:STN domain-containing protein [Pirellulales bacterium]